ncbi:hypothetical protein BT63DRAFT_249463 [Microthyrium microscopicum]|uniref:Uncharacterized protein n=1 Tax=Microthyrium microscopicum TaxID=703497 RepID=A0A6A6UC87_9PEZI|nr:hypothetical protein BT63DRAFT_249463 [Microthyrium microscopicum]
MTRLAEAAGCSYLFVVLDLRALNISFASLRILLPHCHKALPETVMITQVGSFLLLQLVLEFCCQSDSTSLWAKGWVIICAEVEAAINKTQDQIDLARKRPSYA